MNKFYVPIYNKYDSRRVHVRIAHTYFLFENYIYYIKRINNLKKKEKEREKRKF